MTDFVQTTLGGGIQGIAPKITGITLDTSVIPRDRYVIRKAFANSYHYKGNSMSVMRQELAQTPFRLAMNAGDPMSRQNIGGGSDQVSSRVGGFAGLAKSYNGAGNGDGASGNQHFVYDSSDYIRFKKLQGKTRNYNDKTFGGSNNGSYSAIMRVRR